jgi:hypothetical protein
MAHVTGDVESPLPPQVFLNALTDFSDQRPELWPNLERSYYKVHSVSDTSAEVTEGGKGVWERARYDWSDPGTVRIEVLDSNTFLPGSYWIYSAGPTPSGGSRVHYEFLRKPRTAKGFLLSGLLTLFGRKIFDSFLHEMLRRLQDRRPPAAGSTTAPRPSPA